MSALQTKAVKNMDHLRCLCGKIVAQVDADHQMGEMDAGDSGSNVIAIRCRHCKRYILIHVEGIKKVDYR